MKGKMIFLFAFLILSPPSIREIKYTDKTDVERIQFRIPNGFGINGIRVDVTIDKQENGLKLARELLEILHPEREYTVEVNGVIATVKARDPVHALILRNHWFRVIGESH